MSVQPQRLLVRRDDPAQTHREPIDADAALPPGQARLRVESFALTANNVTYAMFGEAMHYWRFFPAPEPWGCVPVWGFASVEASACLGVAVGDRYWGFWPMATHCTVEPTGVSKDGFVDGQAPRAELPPVYNRYQRAGAALPSDGAYAVLRPLFATAFLIDDFLAEHDDFGAHALLLSSASSKTAYATAFCIARREARRARVIGLTSASRVRFAKTLGLYDDCLDYTALASLPAATPTVYIDFAGDAELRQRVHRHFDGHLAYSCSVGGTHHDALGGGRGLPGPKPVLFFAPSQLQHRAAPPPLGLGRAELLRRIELAWQGFLARATDAASPWLEIEARHGADAVQQTWVEVFEGRADAAKGLVLRW